MPTESQIQDLRERFTVMQNNRYRADIKRAGSRLAVRDRYQFRFALFMEKLAKCDRVRRNFAKHVRREESVLQELRKAA